MYAREKIKTAKTRRRYTLLPDPPDPTDMTQHKYITEIDTILRTRYGGRADVYIDGQGYLCYRTTELMFAPDCIISFGVDAEALEDANGYTISEVGKPPDFVLEVASQSTGRRDYTEKRVGYERLLVGEYWRFDNTGGEYHDRALAGDLLVDGRYVDIELHVEADGMIWGHSPALGLDLCWDNGRLRFYDPVAGEYLRSHSEAEAERIAAEAERASAEARAGVAEARVGVAEHWLATERQAREAAEAEVRRLREMLLRLERGDDG